jgi:hypothetical protein
MKKLAYNALYIAVMIALTSGCTANDRAKQYGGTMRVNLDPGQKFLNVTWKETELWILTRPMRPGESPETYTFKEDSTFNLVEGTVILTEQANK